MTTRNKRIAAIAAIVLGIIVVIAVVLAVRGCGSGEKDADTTTTATKSTATMTDTVRVETITVTTPAPAPAPEPDHGPYMTQAQATVYVEGLIDSVTGMPMVTVDPGTTWHPDAVLHAIRATVSGSASYAGDYYYFFVNGYLVGQEYFTHGEPAAPPDTNTFMVSFAVYNPGDPHCCPSGGTATVRFRWNGSSLQTLDPMTGAVMS